MTDLRAFGSVSAAIVVAFLALAVGRCQGEREARKDVAVEIAQANAQIVVQYTRAIRDTVAVMTARSDALERQRLAERANSAKVVQTARAETEAARAVLADTSATTAMLRNTAMVLAVTVDSLLAVIDRKDALADSVAAAHARERKAFQDALFAADSLDRARARVIGAQQQQGKCRIVGPIPCPSRTTSALLGAAGVVVVLVAAR